MIAVAAEPEGHVVARFEVQLGPKVLGDHHLTLGADSVRRCRSHTEKYNLIPRSATGLGRSIPGHEGGLGYGESVPAPRILLINGPNLNMLGERDPHEYGTATLADIEAGLTAKAKELGVELECRQSNHEGEIVTWLQDARHGHDGIVYNPGAHAHYSYAIRDAIEPLKIPVVEVHISNIYNREAFRHHSVISAVAAGVITGCGVLGYELALRMALDKAPGPRP